MKIIYKISFSTLIVLLLFTTSCKDYLDDVAKDPDNPTAVPENLLLGGLLGNFSYQIIGNDPTRFTSYWIQYTAFTGVPPSQDNYDVDESDVNNLWSYNSYPAVMHNAKILAEQGTLNENFHYAALGRIILAWNLSIVTDLWNEVPYSEAFNPQLTTKPKYDSQESIYKAIQELLDLAIVDLDKSSIRSPSTDDLLYPQATAATWRTSSLPKWRKLAYTLKARFHMRLTNAPGYDPVAQSNLALEALAKGFTSNADNAEFAYYNNEGSENPWFQWTIDGKWNDDTRLSEYYVEKLKSLQDPRLAIQADLSEGEKFKGAPNGEGNVINDSISNIGGFYSAADAPLQWMTYAEAKFLEAEATLRTKGAAAADPIYKSAIEASLTDLEVSEENIETYLAERPSLEASNGLKEIMNQKYIALFLQFEAYNDWRRTGFPDDLNLAANARTRVIPLRFPYPEAELLNNAENVGKTGVPSGTTGLEVPVWWDK